MVVGVLQVEMHVPNAQSLKDKRSVIKRLKAQLRGRFNVSVAELAPNEMWQRATVGVSAVGDDRAAVSGVLRDVTEWLRHTPVVGLSRVEEDYF